MFESGAFHLPELGELSVLLGELKWEISRSFPDDDGNNKATILVFFRSAICKREKASGQTNETVYS